MTAHAEPETEMLGEPPAEGGRLNSVLAVLAAIVTIVMMLHVTANALFRSFLDAPIHGTLEYTQYYYLPFIAFIGIVTAQKAKEHIEARLLFDFIPAKAQPYVQAGTDLLTLALGVALAFYTFEMALESMEIGRTAGVSGVVIWPATFVAPIGYVLFSAYVLTDLISILKPAATGSGTPSEAKEATDA